MHRFLSLLFLTLILVPGVVYTPVEAQSVEGRLPKTVIFKLNPEFRDLCAGGLMDYPAFTDLEGNLGTFNFHRMFPNHEPPRHLYNNEGFPLTDLSLIYEMSYAADVSVEKVVRFMANMPVILYAQPHYLPKPLYVPNDDSVSLSTQYHLDKIQAFSAWDVDKGDSNVVIGITDTGVDTAHIDLRDNIKYNYADPIDGVDNDNDGFTDNFRGWDLGDNDKDPSSTGIWWHHGTAVAGLAAASTDNGIQGAGVGFRCKFLPIKISRNSDGELISAYEGIVYAADHGCQIINCSWGSKDVPGSFEQDVVNYATFNKNALVVAAAGNSGDESVLYPASLKYVLSVGGTDVNDVKFNVPSSASSNYGRHLDICTPGAYIMSSTVPSSFGLVNSGTSLSSPIAAGCAAVVKSRFPNYSALQVGEQLKVTADTIDTVPGNENFKEKLGSGRANLYAAITDTTKPSIVLIKHVFNDGNDGQFRTGDTISFIGTFMNFLAPTKGVTVYVQMSSANPDIAFIQSTVAIGQLNTLDTAGNYGNPIKFRIKSSAGYDETIELRLEYRDLATKLHEFLTIAVNRSVVDIDVNEISTSLTGESRIGFNVPVSPDPVLGLGFQYKGEQLIYEAGLMVGAQIAGSTYVSDNLWDSLAPDEDFINTDIARETVSAFADIAAVASATDDGAGSEKMNISLDQSIYAWAEPPDEKYIMLGYNIINNGPDSLLNLYAGICTDWDIRNFNANKASHDPGKKMGYVKSTDAGAPFAAVKLLSPGPYHHYAIDNYAGAPGLDIFYPNSYSTVKKYTALSTDRPSAGGTGSGNDVIDVVSAGPFTLAPQDTIAVAFAMLAGDDLLDLVSAANAAQARYDLLFSEPEDTTAIPANGHPVQGYGLFPNPSNGLITLQFDQPLDDFVLFELVDITGRVAYTAKLRTGTRRSRCDLSTVTPGVYQYSLQSESWNAQGKLVVLQ